MSLRAALEAATHLPGPATASVVRRIAAFDAKGREQPRPLLTLYSRVTGTHSLLLVVGVPASEGPDDWTDGLEDPFAALEFGAHNCTTPETAVTQVLAQVLAHLDAPPLDDAARTLQSRRYVVV